MNESEESLLRLHLSTFMDDELIESYISYAKKSNYICKLLEHLCYTSTALLQMKYVMMLDKCIDLFVEI